MVGVRLEFGVRFVVRFAIVFRVGITVIVGVSLV